MSFPYTISGETIYSKLMILDILHMALLKFLDDYAHYGDPTKNPKCAQIEVLYIDKIDRTVSVKFKLDDFSEEINLPQVAAATIYNTLNLETLSDKELAGKGLYYRGYNATNYSYNLLEMLSDKKHFKKKGNKYYMVL